MPRLGTPWRKIQLAENCFAYVNDALLRVLDNQQKTSTGAERCIAVRVCTGAGRCAKNDVKARGVQIPRIEAFGFC